MPFDPEETVLDEDLIVVPKSMDDDRNFYHDKSVYYNIKVKQEVSSDEEKNATAIPIGPIQPHQPQKKSRHIKVKYICHICGQDYLNESDLTNHIAQHEGIMYNCDTCHKTFHSRKSFDTHNKVYLEGLLIYNQCGKTFEYVGSLQNHLQKHKGIFFNVT